MIFLLLCLMGYATFIWLPGGFPTREQVTYNCPWENHEFSRLTPQTLHENLGFIYSHSESTSDCKLLLFKFNVSWYRWYARFQHIFSIIFPFRMIALITLFSNVVTVRRVPLQRRGWLIFRFFDLLLDDYRVATLANAVSSKTLVDGWRQIYFIYMCVFGR